MKVVPLHHRADIRLAQLIAHQFGLSTATDAVDQLISQLSEFRREREEQIAALKREFDDAIRELQAELDRTKAFSAHFNAGRAAVQMRRFLISEGPEKHRR